MSTTNTQRGSGVIGKRSGGGGGGVRAVPGFTSPRRTGRRASIGGATPAISQEKTFVTNVISTSMTSNNNNNNDNNNNSPTTTSTSTTTRAGGTISSTAVAVPTTPSRKTSKKLQWPKTPTKTPTKSPGGGNNNNNKKNNNKNNNTVNISTNKKNLWVPPLTTTTTTTTGGGDASVSGGGGGGGDEKSKQQQTISSSSATLRNRGGKIDRNNNNNNNNKNDPLGSSASEHIRGGGGGGGSGPSSRGGALLGSRANSVRHVTRSTTSQQQQQQQSLSQSMHVSHSGGNNKKPASILRSSHRGTATTTTTSVASKQPNSEKKKMASSSSSSLAAAPSNNNNNNKTSTSTTTNTTGTSSGSRAPQPTPSQHSLQSHNSGGGGGTGPSKTGGGSSGESLISSAMADKELQNYMQSTASVGGGTTAMDLHSKRSGVPTPVSAASSSVASYSSRGSSSASPTSTVGTVPSTNNMSLLYFLARCCDWEGVLEEVQVNPRDAKVVSEKDGTTALHLAVMSRTNPMMRDGKAGEPAPLSVLEELVKACPEAAIIRCAMKRYTPLHYACLVADSDYDMEDCSQIVEILMKHSPHCPFVFTDDGFSALDVHILSYGQLHKHKAAEVYSGGSRTSTVVLRTLLAGEPSLADTRVYRNKIRGPLELLYRCNIDEFKEAVEFEELSALEHHDEMKRKERIQRFGAETTSILSDWWAWKWSLLLLKFASISAGQEVVPFNAVHAASRVVGCPLPILALAVSTYPQQVMERDRTGDIYNLPLHEVCTWRSDTENIAGDPFIATRKFKAMRLLLDQFPEAARMTNNCGETPLQLAVETCTPWHGGLEKLVEACPKALKFPRKLRITDNGLSLAVAHHSAIDSIATVDSDEPDPLEYLENMYPFMVAAVLGGVSKSRLRPPVSYSDEMASDHEQNLERKSLQAVRAVYGLLRSRPEVLEKYRKFVQAEGEEEHRRKGHG